MLKNSMQCNSLNTKNTTNNNDYFIDVTNLGFHNKDFALVTQASILVIYIFYVIECKTLYGSRVHSHNIPQHNLHHNRHIKSKGKATTIDNKLPPQKTVSSQ